MHKREEMRFFRLISHETQLSFTRSTSSYRGGYLCFDPGIRIGHPSFSKLRTLDCLTSSGIILRSSDPQIRSPSLCVKYGVRPLPACPSSSDVGFSLCGLPLRHASRLLLPLVGPLTENPTNHLRLKCFVITCEAKTIQQKC